MEKRGNTNPNQRKREKKMKKLSLILIGLLACFAIGISTVQGQQYSLEDLGVVKGMDVSLPAAVNFNGHVAGTAYKKGEICAFYYDYLQKLMYDAGGNNSRGFGINFTNLIVGDSVFVTGIMEVSHAAMFKGGYVTDLGVLPGQVFSRANGINATNQVVGYSGAGRDANESRAFMWSSQTGMIDIGTLGGAYAQANAINDAGVITGASETQDMGPIKKTHAFIYRFPTPPYPRHAPMIDLGVLGTGLFSFGTAINSDNHVAGYSTVSTKDARVHGFLHNGKNMIDLGSLGGYAADSDNSVALGVNSRDQVVGYTYLPAFGDMALQQVAFLWSRNENGIGKMANLNHMVDKTGRNYLLISATGINDKGQIAAVALDIYNGGLRAVLLTPFTK
jgi:probable HAF family extracellular repeat protein